MPLPPPQLHSLQLPIYPPPSPTRSSMAALMSTRKPLASTTIAMAETACWYCALLLVALVLLSSLRGGSEAAEDGKVRGGAFAGRPCDDIYVVGEGETLHTISEKCGDPYIVEQNPHIHDPDDVFPGLVIKITPSKPARRR